MKALFYASCLVLPLMAACPAPTAVAPVKVTIKPEKAKTLEIREPSDIALSADQKNWFIVSDNGALYKTDLEGNVVAKAEAEAFDMEGVYANADFVYVVDERTRLVHFYNAQTLEHTRAVEVPYPGGRNKGFESITWNAAKGVFVVITEKDPKLVFELDKDNLEVRNRVELKGFPSDISSATYHNDFLYVLSDEEHCVLKVDPRTYAIVSRWETNLLNPEGIAFGPDGTLYIVSDDMGTLYTYTASTLQ